MDVIKSRPTPSPSPATVKFPKVAETALSDDATTHAGCELTAIKVPASNEHTVKGDVTTDAKVTCSLVADPKVSDDVNAARNVHVAVSADCKVINDVIADSIVNDGKTNTPLKMMAMAVEEQATSPSNCCQGNVVITKTMRHLHLIVVKVTSSLLKQATPPSECCQGNVVITKTSDTSI